MSSKKIKNPSISSPIENFLIKHNCPQCCISGSITCQSRCGCNVLTAKIPPLPGSSGVCKPATCPISPILFEGMHPIRFSSPNVDQVYLTILDEAGFSMISKSKRKKSTLKSYYPKEIFNKYKKAEKWSKKETIIVFHYTLKEVYKKINYSGPITIIEEQWSKGEPISIFKATSKKSNISGK